jgi:hypothetical protein
VRRAKEPLEQRLLGVPGMRNQHSRPEPAGKKRVRLALLGALLLGGLVAGGATACATYDPGSLVAYGHGPNLYATQLGCLEIAVTASTQSPAPPTSPVLSVHMGNACHGPVHVDLGGLVVLADYGRGSLERLNAYDPLGEIHAGLLEGRWEATERIEFDPVTASTVPPSALRVDLAGITDDGSTTGSATASTTWPTSLCFAAATPGGALGPVPCAQEVSP